MNKYSMDFLQKLLFAISVLSFTALVLVLVFHQAPQKQPEVPEPNKTITANNSSNVTVSDSDVWIILTPANVEDQCLKQARDYAKNQGFPPYAVLSCSCEGNESSEVKTYECTINSLDGDYHVGATCVKSQARCIFNTTAGLVYYGFDELAEMMLE
jgi:hypothetical protein